MEQLLPAFDKGERYRPGYVSIRWRGDDHGGDGDAQTHTDLRASARGHVRSHELVGGRDLAAAGTCGSAWRFRRVQRPAGTSRQGSVAARINGEPVPAARGRIVRFAGAHGGRLRNALPGRAAQGAAARFRAGGLVRRETV